MTEKFPSTANISESVALRDHLVTQEDIDTAGFQDVPVAIDNYIDNVHARLDSTTSPAVQKGLEKELERGELATDWSIKWFENNKKRTEAYQGRETFKQFLDRIMQEETHPAVLEQIDKVSTFVYSGAYDKFMGDTIRARQQQEAQEAGETQAVTSQPEQPRTELPEAAEQQAAEKQHAVNEAREAVEQARGVEMFDDIVKFAKGSTYLYTDLENGYKDLSDAKHKDPNRVHIPQHIKQEAYKSPDYRKHLNEAVMFSDITESDTRIATRERRVKGRFGRIHTETYPETEIVPNSSHLVMIHNEQTSQEEPAVRFRYNFKYSDHIPLDDINKLPPYLEFQGGRNGQTIKASVDLPKTVADRLKIQIEDDPKSVRDLVEKLFLNNHNGLMTEEYWREGGTVKHPIRPPYEGLPKNWLISMIDENTQNGSQDYQIKHLSAN